MIRTSSSRIVFAIILLVAVQASTTLSAPVENVPTTSGQPVSTAPTGKLTTPVSSPGGIQPQTSKPDSGASNSVPSSVPSPNNSTPTPSFEGKQLPAGIDPKNTTNHSTSNENRTADQTSSSTSVLDNENQPKSRPLTPATTPIDTSPTSHDNSSTTSTPSSSTAQVTSDTSTTQKQETQAATNSSTPPHADKQGSHSASPATVEEESGSTGLIIVLVLGALALVGGIVAFAFHKYKNRRHEGNLRD